MSFRALVPMSNTKGFRRSVQSFNSDYELMRSFLHDVALCG